MPTHPQVDEAFAVLERLAGEIQLKLHLAGMEAKDAWSRELEPRLFEARTHAREAKDASGKAVDDVIEALRALSASL